MSTVSTEMTFGISRDQGVFEWAGTSLSAVFAQKWNIFKPRVWHMLFDIVRFNQFALDLLATEEEVEEDPNSVDAPFKKSRKQESIGTYLDREGYSEAFREDYLIPMTACVWSTTPEKCSLDFPALTLVRFLWNHHLLTTISERPEWRTIKEGSKLYIDAVMDGVSQHKVHLEATLRSLKVLESGQVRLLFQNGSSEVFDHVILATHGNQAMSIMEEAATEEERAILSAFETSANTAVLHSDKSVSSRNQSS